MSQRRRDICAADLDHFVDARLDQARRDEVAAYLAEHPEIAEELEAQRHLNARLRARFDPVLDEAIPSALLRAASGASALGSAGRRQHLRLALGAAALAALGVFGGWWWRGSSDAPADWRVFVEEAAYAHQTYSSDTRRPVELDASKADELVAWASRRLGVPVRVPSLDAAGFRLLGGRILPGTDGPAAQFMYQNATSERLTLYLRSDLRNRHTVQFQFAPVRRPTVLYWLDGPRGYALAGELDRDSLMRIARRVYQQLDT